jgi:prepilin-type N-terminal cleavage/methylation domain-containing protein
MAKSRSTQGFTLIEMAIVLMIIGAMVAAAIPSLSRYRARESAKARVHGVASALREGRTRAMKEGRSYLVYMDMGCEYDAEIEPEPSLGTVDCTYARVVQDTNNDGVESTGDALAINFTDGPKEDFYFTPHQYDFASSDGVDPSGSDKPFQQGETFALVSDVGVVGFTPRGIPFDPTSATEFGSGVGSYFWTDAAGGVFAVSVLPLGQVVVRSRVGNEPWQ